MEVVYSEKKQARHYGVSWLHEKVAGHPQDEAVSDMGLCASTLSFLGALVLLRFLRIPGPDSPMDQLCSRPVGYNGPLLLCSPKENCVLKLCMEKEHCSKVNFHGVLPGNHCPKCTVLYAH